jgi:hypothetical protein
MYLKFLAKQLSSTSSEVLEYLLADAKERILSTEDNPQYIRHQSVVVELIQAELSARKG